MFYVFHGTEEFQRSEAVARQKAAILKDGMGDLNITVLDGRRVGLAEVMDRASAYPFLTQRRLVVVEGLLQRYERRSVGDDETAEDAPPPPVGDEMARLAAYLPTMPRTTRLVFVENRALSPKNPILALAVSHPDGYAKEFRPLTGPELSRWVTERAGAIGVEASRDAVNELLPRTDNDLRRIDAELHKLAAHADYRRAITAADVRELVPEDVDKTVWALVDALGNRQAATALNLLEDNLQQRDPKHPLYYLTMFARQIRLLLTLKDLVAQGLRGDQVQREMAMRAYPFRKLQDQAGAFGAEELEAMLARVLEIDQEYKTGRADGPLALEMLILEICSWRRSAAPRAHQASSRSRTRAASATSASSPEPRSR